MSPYTIFICDKGMLHTSLRWSLVTNFSSSKNLKIRRSCFECSFNAFAKSSSLTHWRLLKKLSLSNKQRQQKCYGLQSIRKNQVWFMLSWNFLFKNNIRSNPTQLILTSTQHMLTVNLSLLRTHFLLAWQCQELKWLDSFHIQFSTYKVGIVWISTSYFNQK